MNKHIRLITQTAVMLALLISLQALTKPMGQLVTGSFVNAVLAVTALFVGLPGGLAVALLSPVAAYLLGIAPQLLTVPAIMVGNTVYVIVLARLESWKLLGWLTASLAKFAALYAIVVLLFCGVLSETLLASGMLKAPMLQVLPVTFSWLQLCTALIGGGAALLILPLLRKALRK